MSEQYGWHWLPDNRCLANEDGRTVVVGETLRVEPPLAMCNHGLHWCKRPIDALQYAPGVLVCYVRAGGETLEEGDKCCSVERTVIAMADATALLHEFACWCAENALRAANVTDQRCWNAIEVKRRWLRKDATDEELDAARAAAWAAAGAAGAAAWAAAWAAAGAAGAAAWDAAGDAAWAATGTAARAAAWDAARAAWAVARAVARAAQNTELERRLRELLGMEEAKP
jgi:hypothetical protein